MRRTTLPLHQATNTVENDAAQNRFDNLSSYPQRVVIARMLFVREQSISRLDIINAVNIKARLLFT